MFSLGGGEGGEWETLEEWDTMTNPKKEDRPPTQK